MNMDYDRVLIVSCIICVTFTISFSKVHLFDFLVCLNVDIYVNDVDTFDWFKEHSCKEWDVCFL
jgi:hypothetical protein